jgi:phenylpropionate dioxygenase-like ring-hydroxylating dioxygenase large terminal subunit
MAIEDMIEAVDDGPGKEAIAAFRRGMTPFWHPVCETKALDAGKPVGVVLLGRRLVVARLGDRVAALPDVCRHFQAQLSLGEIVEIAGERALQCPYHGWAFSGSGRCVRIPQLPASRDIPGNANLPAYAAVEHLGLVWVTLAEAPTAELPTFAEFADPAFRKIRLTEADTTKTSATRMIMGTLDDTHFPWVHEGILGERDRPDPPEHTARREGAELLVEYEIEQPAGLMARGGAGTTVRLRYENRVHMPTTVCLRKHMPDGLYAIWLACSPVDYNVTRNFWIFARDYDLDPLRDPVYEEMSAHVRSQDKPVIESQRPWLIPPFWSRIQMPIGPGDLPLIEYQRWLQELKIATAV